MPHRFRLSRAAACECAILCARTSDGTAQCDMTPNSAHEGDATSRFMALARASGFGARLRWSRLQQVHGPGVGTRVWPHCACFKCALRMLQVCLEACAVCHLWCGHEGVDRHLKPEQRVTGQVNDI
eukprot:363990-Chlamydomonas_euryale.AAC.5